MYVIAHKTDDLYVHYNPHKEAYVLDDRKQGAAVFTYENGTNFLNQAGLQDDFRLVEMNNNVKVLKGSRKDEPALYDQLH